MSKKDNTKDLNIDDLNTEDTNENDETIKLDSHISSDKVDETTEKTLNLSDEQKDENNNSLADNFKMPVSDEGRIKNDELTEEQIAKLAKLKERKKIKPVAKYSFVIAYFVVMIAISIGGVFALTYFISLYNNETSNVNNASFYKSKQSTAIYDKVGNQITSLTVNYVDWVDLETVPEIYTQAVVATEDGGFYEHGGVDYDALVKGAIQQVLKGSDRGGSTITMQLGKVLYMEEWYLGDPANGVDPLKTSKPIEYKLLQMSYALKLESMYSKDQILENYINSVNFGSAYGVENASLYYFGHSASELTLSESALLAGLPQSPNNYNPIIRPENAQARRDDVLASLLREGFITEAQYKEEKEVDVTSLLLPEDQRVETEESAYVPYLDIVQRELNELLTEMEPEGQEEGDEQDASTSGLKVYTHLDVSLQEKNYNDISSANTVIQYQDDKIQNGSAQIDTQTGAIYAVTNGRGDRGRGGTNFAYNYTRQPGSTSKPLIDYAPAIEYLDWSTYHQIEDSEIKYRGQDTGPANSSGTYSGTNTMQYHLGHSNNTPALRAFYAVVDGAGGDPAGRAKIGEFLNGLGITDIPVNETTGEYAPYDAYSIGGWNYGTTPVELAGAYAAFGNGGTYNEPHTIDYIEVEDTSPYYDKLGDRYNYEYESHTGMKEETAYLMTQMLDVTNTEASTLAGSAARGPSSYDLGHMYQSVPELYAKTGTSNWGTNKYGFDPSDPRDRWVAGYTKDITTVVWTGYEETDEKAGYKLSLSEYAGGNDVYHIFHRLTWNANDDDSEYLHDAPEIEMPENVYSESKNGIDYYFIENSSDTPEEFEAPVPELKNGSQSGDSFTFTWSYEERDGISFNIYIDGKLLTTTTESSYTITADDFVNAAGCKSSYKVTVSSTVEDSESEQSNEATVDYGSDSFCKEVEETTPPSTNKPDTEQDTDIDTTTPDEKEEEKNPDVTPPAGGGNGEGEEEEPKEEEVIT